MPGPDAPVRTALTERAREALLETRRTWLVTGAAGFIGSHLVEELLGLDQRVVGLDNLSTGSRRNLEDVAGRVGEERWGRFRFVEGDVASPEACREACGGAGIVLHEAALGSVPRSLADPAATHESNATGTLRVLVAARDAGVERVVYASSSSVYGDEPGLPRVEDRTGRPLSPYAASKAAGELYAEAFARSGGPAVFILRYFNVFGPRQDPLGPYAAVVPRWIGELLSGRAVAIHGDGRTSRDFCYVANVVHANLLAAAAEPPRRPRAAIYNVAAGRRTTLDALFAAIRERVARFAPEAARRVPEYRDFRPGDVRHSLADIERAREELGYAPTVDLERGLDETVGWFAGRRALASDRLSGAAVFDTGETRPLD